MNTCLDSEVSREVSAIAGLTYNLENSTTQYESGSEFHLEYSLVQNFSEPFAVGVNGYYYEPGVRLGSFEARLVALGPVMNLKLQLGQIPVSAALRYFREFEVRNRLEGDAGYANITIPLSVAGQ